MDNLSGDITNLIFRKVLRGDLGEVSLDGQSLAILMQLDGNKSLGRISQATGLTMIQTRACIAKLLKLNLIVPADSSVPEAPVQEFLSFLKEQLSRAVGPIAEVLIEDAADEMGITLPSVPLSRGPEMIEIIGSFIPREEKRLAFQSAMLTKIRELGTA
ncbi:MAG: hypothetical protein ACLFQR_01020 [Desulfovibrionales bacterium]